MSLEIRCSQLVRNTPATFALVIVFLIVGCTANPTTSQRTPGDSPLKAETQPSGSASPFYRILASKDESVLDRKRLFFSIEAPEAKTFEARGQTVVTAARQLQRRNQADVVQVWLEPNENTRGLGLVLAMATYSPDGKGMSGMETSEIWYNVTATDYQINSRTLARTKQSKLRDISIEQARIISSRRSYKPGEEQ
jgi:hypothetical protein